MSDTHSIIINKAVWYHTTGSTQSTDKSTHLSQTVTEKHSRESPLPFCPIEIQRPSTFAFYFQPIDDEELQQLSQGCVGFPSPPHIAPCAASLSTNGRSFRRSNTNSPPYCTPVTIPGELESVEQTDSAAICGEPLSHTQTGGAAELQHDTNTTTQQASYAAELQQRPLTLSETRGAASSHPDPCRETFAEPAVAKFRGRPRTNRRLGESEEEFRRYLDQWQRQKAQSGKRSKKKKTMLWLKESESLGVRESEDDEDHEDDDFQDDDKSVASHKKNHHKTQKTSHTTHSLKVTEQTSRNFKIAKKKRKRDSESESVNEDEDSDEESDQECPSYPLSTTQTTHTTTASVAQRESRLWREMTEWIFVRHHEQFAFNDHGKEREKALRWLQRAMESDELREKVFSHAVNLLSEDWKRVMAEE